MTHEGTARQALGAIDPRRTVAVAAGKAAGTLSRVLNRGGGTALPGLVAITIDAHVVHDLSAQLAGIGLVSGTNGKTTTSRMLASILDRANYRLLRNQSGSNLIRGVATSLVERANLFGKIPSSPDTFGIFEIDEAALPDVLQAMHPQTLTLLDLFRDQLDRYGEVATVARLWSGAVAKLDAGTSVIINADDPLLGGLVADLAGDAVYFGIESANTTRGEEHASDVKTCPRCGGAITYDTVYFGHLGHYRCSGCGFMRPRPAVAAIDVQLLGIRGSSFRLTTPGGNVSVNLKLPGLYNVYNALGAAATAWSLGIDVGTIAGGLDASTPPFGRMERLQVQGRDVFIALAKNPAGLNEVLRTVTEDPAPLNLMMMLNDNIADGRDVSWIWDADIEMLAGHVAGVTFAGTRAADMALRFKYAEALPTTDSLHICADTQRAFARALEATPAGAPLFIIPTYTALLDIRATLTQLGNARPYWEE